MKKLLLLLAGIATLGGCAYTSPVAVGDKVVLAKNNSFFFGILREVYVCQVTDGGLTSCQTSQNP